MPMPVNVWFISVFALLLSSSLTPSETQTDSSVITVSSSQDNAASLNFFSGAQASNALLLLVVHLSCSEELTFFIFNP